VHDLRGMGTGDSSATERAHPEIAGMARTHSPISAESRELKSRTIHRRLRTYSGESGPSTSGAAA
jgi:hypothetical protein